MAIPHSIALKTIDFETFGWERGYERGGRVVTPQTERNAALKAGNRYEPFEAGLSLLAIGYWLLPVSLLLRISSITDWMRALAPSMPLSTACRSRAGFEGLRDEAQ
jgi:hypothetical protein